MRRLKGVSLYDNERLSEACRSHAAFTYVTHHARLHLRIMQKWLKSVYCPSCHLLEKLTHVPRSVLTSLDWWMDPARVCSVVPFAPTVLSITLIVCDSFLGWGAHVENFETQGLWSV